LFLRKQEHFLFNDANTGTLYSTKEPKRESQEGYFSGKKNTTGHQLARVSAIDSRETIWSDIHPGNRLPVQCLQPAVLPLEIALELTPGQTGPFLHPEATST